MFLGIDLGTSSVKALLVDADERTIGEASAPLEVMRPQPLWSEQDPEEWWRALEHCMEALGAAHPRELAGVCGLGLSGQMHGATLLDDRDRVLRPAILWNDGRSAAQCRELERREPRLRDITGNRAMPGFTAPKLLWVAEHEPEIRRQVATVLLPKDYLRLRLSGERVSDVSDAAGTLWLDVARRRWSAEMLAATGLGESAMPRLVEGSEPSGTVRAAVAAAWGLRKDVVIAGGGGDNAASAVGVGVVRPGQAFLSLGTSGVYFVATDRFAPNPAGAVHAFCHCLPATWHQMSVILSAASCLTWVTMATGARDEAALLEEIDSADGQSSEVIFLPYLSGERTPHDDPNAKGVFFGLTHTTTRADLGRAVLEGVAFALADGQAALQAVGTRIDDVALIGGGARSRLWGRILASALGRTLRHPAGGEIGASLGAARLGRLAVSGEDAAQVCRAPATEWIAEPDPELRERLSLRHQTFGRLYRELRDVFATIAPPA